MFNFKKLVVFEESIRIGRYLFCVVKASRSGNIKSDRMKRCSVAQNGSDDSLPPLNSLMDREQTREEEEDGRENGGEQLAGRTFSLHECGQRLYPAV